MNKKSGVINEKELRDRTGEVLFMDLRRWDGQIEEIVIDRGKKKKKICRSAMLDEIREKGFSIALSKYIEFVDHDLEIDYPAEMTRIQNDMRELLSLEKIRKSYSRTLLEVSAMALNEFVRRDMFD